MIIALILPQMADYADGWFKQKQKKRYFMNSSKALGLQREMCCSGLAAFLLGPEARHFFELGLRFYGVQFETTDQNWPVTKTLQLGESRDYKPEKIYLVPINNHYGDQAMFCDAKLN